MGSKKKGFTMIELLATIIILGLLVSLAYFGVRGILDRGNNSYYASQEDMLILAGREYYADHRGELPKDVGKTASVTLETLINESYIDPIKDRNENDCNKKTTSVTVQKITERDYQYYTTLACDEYETTEDTAKPVITFDPNKKSSTKSITTTMKVTDNVKVASYRYVITKDGEDYKDSGYQNYDGDINIKLTEKGLYEIVGYAIDSNGNRSSKRSGKFSIYEGIDCAEVTFSSNVKVRTWTNKNITVTMKLPDNTYRWELSQRVDGGSYVKVNDYIGSGNQKLTLTADGKHQLKLVLYDEDGNTCTATTGEYYIDKTAPTCVSSGGSTSWTNKDITLKGTCSDKGGSGCVEDVTKKFTTNTDKTNQSPGTVEDKAGNTAKCPANQTVKIDKTAPTCKSSGGNSSWTNKNVTITGTCSDKGGSGCTGDVSRNYTTNTNTTTASPGTVKDNAGNETKCSSNQTVKIDKNPPTCKSSGGSTSWTKKSITLIGTCSDTGGSGCRANIKKYFSSDINTTNQSPGTVSDNAGNTTSCPADQTVKIDKTAPKCTSSGGSSSWTNKDKTITGTCSDGSGSGCTGNVTKTYTTNTNTTTASPGTVKDNVGNTTTCPANQTVKIDKTAPKCTSSGGSTSWKKTNVTLKGTCSDTGGSGCTGNVTKDYTDDTNVANQSPGTVKDNAGNTATCPANQTVKIDKTAPTCTSSGGSNNWTNGIVTLVGTCSDNLSGCTTNKVTISFSSNTNITNRSPGTVRDNAGNTATCPANQTVKVDTTAPKCTSSGGSSSWTNKNITLVGTCSDTGGSGCIGNVTQTYVDNTNLTNQSPGTVYDNAGNKATCPANQTVKIDKNAPTCKSSGGSTSWTTNNITLIGTCSDTGGSGCTGNVSKIFSSQGEWYNQSPGTVRDNAGNTATCPADQTVKITGPPTAPTINLNGYTSGSWTNKNVTITMSSTSQVGIDHYEYSHWSDAGWNNDFDVNPSGWQRVYNNSDRSKMSVTISWDGSWDFYIRAVDKNGVPSEPSKVFTVRVDKTAPTCVSSGGSSSWTSGSRTIKGTCSDTGGSGCTGNVSRTYSTPGEWYNQSPGTVRDNAGNTKICPNNQTIRIAGPPSRPTINLNGYTSATWTNQNVTITMSSSSNIGIDHYEYSHDGTNWINDFNNNPTGWQRVYHNNNKTSMSVTISWEGNWNFYIRAVDKNGNVSPNSIMFTVRIDKTPPVVILNKVNILQTNSSGAWINFFFLQGGQCNYALCQNSVFDSWQLVNVVGSLGMSFEMTQTDNLSGVIANTGSYNWDMYDLDKNIYISSCLSSQGNRRCRWTQRYTVRDAAGNTSNTATAIVYMHYP